MEFKEEDLKLENEQQSINGMRVSYCPPFIKATYLPTGLIVICRKHYSQHKNAEECKNIIKDIISEQIEIINIKE